MSEVDVQHTHDRAIPDRAKALAADAGREVLARANQQASRGMDAMGEGLSRAADRVGSERIAGGLKSAATYLKGHDPQSMLVDVDGAVRRHPYRAVAIGLGLGYFVGRWVRAER